MASELQLVRRSPIEALAGELAAASGDLVRIEPVPFRSVLNVRGASSEEFAAAIEAALGMPLPPEPNRWNGDRDRAAIWLGPDEWLLLAPEHESRQLEQAVRDARPDDPRLSVTDVSHNYSGFRLSGPRTRELLSMGCSLDFHPCAFGAGSCAQTTLARAPVWLRGLHDDGSIEVWMRNSFAAYLARWLMVSASGL